MAGEISRQNGEHVRPSWRYLNGIGNSNWRGYETHSLEMLESIRNVLDAILASQMLQCDVAHAIKRLDRTLSRIDKRLAKLEEARLR